MTVASDFIRELVQGLDDVLHEHTFDAQHRARPGSDVRVLLSFDDEAAVRRATAALRDLADRVFVGGA